MASKPITLEGWIEKAQKLLKVENAEEVNQEKILYEKHSLKELEHCGYAIRRLEFVSQRSSLGKLMVKLAPASCSSGKDVNLTTMGITKGDPVAISVQNETQLLQLGTVLQVKSQWIEVAFNDEGDFEFLHQNDCFNVIRVKNDVTYRRLKQCLDHLYKNSHKTYLVEMLFGARPLMDPLTTLPPYSVDSLQRSSIEEEEPIVWFNDNLNSSQKEAIDFALRQRHLAIIHGPPGTGKTTTLTEVILQLITRGLKVLVCAPSNVAVDNIFKQLLSASQQMTAKFRLRKSPNFVRLGNPARVDPFIQPYCLDAVVYQGKGSLVSELETELDAAKNESFRNYSKMKSLRKELFKYKAKIFEETLKSAEVIFSTLTSANLDGQLKHLVTGDWNQFSWDVVLVDECAQAMEAASWIPLAHTNKAILAGDHHQLPMTIVSPEAERLGLGISLIERALELFSHSEDKLVRMLTVQYRMNRVIMNWSSGYFYQDRLTAHESVEERRLVSKRTSQPLPVMRLIDTTGCDMYEMQLEDQSLSKGNKYEADIVCLYIQTLLEEGVAPGQIGVITPYNLQCCLIRARCQQMFSDSIFTQLEINSVDAFQGREKEVIILSLVRSNPLADIGFLEEKRRLNVAITRARSHLMVVCDSGTVAKDCAALESFIDYCYQNADVVTASDYLDELQQFEQLTLEASGLSGVKVSKQETKRNKGRKGKPVKKKAEKVAPLPGVTTISVEQIQKMLQDFQLSELKELKLPTSLTNADRKLFHEQCEMLGLQHQSTGLDSQRQLIVFR